MQSLREQRVSSSLCACFLVTLHKYNTFIRLRKNNVRSINAISYSKRKAGERKDLLEGKSAISTGISCLLEQLCSNGVHEQQFD